MYHDYTFCDITSAQWKHSFTSKLTRSHDEYVFNTCATTSQDFNFGFNKNNKNNKAQNGFQDGQYYLSLRA